MLAELDLPGDYAFTVSGELARLLKPYGWVAVNQPAAWQHTCDHPPNPSLPGYAYYGSLSAALGYQREVAPQRC